MRAYRSILLTRLQNSKDFALGRDIKFRRTVDANAELAILTHTQI
jgi:hypothetical protein